MLITGILLIVFGHFFRTLRWKYLIETKNKIHTGVLVRALSVGYAMSVLVPYKLGEIARGFLAGRDQDKNTRARIWASIVFERFCDVVAILLIGLLMYFSSITTSSNFERIKQEIVIPYGTLTIVSGLIFIISTRSNNPLKRMIRRLSSYFESNISNQILLTFYYLLELLRNFWSIIKSPRFFLPSLVMWIFYFMGYIVLSYGTLAGNRLGIEVTFVEIFSLDDQIFWQDSIREGLIRPESIILYLLPTLLILLISKETWSKLSSRFSLEYKSSAISLQFANYKEELRFLTLYFDGKYPRFCDQFKELNQDLDILKDYSGQSGAVTILVADANHIFFRKYEFNFPQTEKIKDQIAWIRNTKSEIVPWILRESYQESFVSYDMKKYEDSHEYFDYLHSISVEEARLSLNQMLTTVGKIVHNDSHFPNDSNPKVIEKYICEKIFANLTHISRIMEKNNINIDEVITVNGVKLGTGRGIIDQIERFTWNSHLALGDWGRVHGDLTIENVIFCKSRRYRFYLIDPNPVKHSFPLLSDFGKLKQSVKSGYEFRNSMGLALVGPNDFRLTMTQSYVYRILDRELDSFLEKLGGEEFKTAAQAHLVVHFLRLLKYSDENELLMLLIMFLEFKSLIESS
jgi:hypothetical protein